MRQHLFSSLDKFALFSFLLLFHSVFKSIENLFYLLVKIKMFLLYNIAFEFGSDLSFFFNLSVIIMHQVEHLL